MNKIQIKKCYPYPSEHAHLLSTRYLKYYEMYTKCAPDILQVKNFLLEFLELNCDKILNIASIQYLTNLKELHIHTSNFKDEDMIWLKNLVNLKRLDLQGTKITDVSSLENLVNLEMLWAPNNAISIIYLEKLIHLKKLCLWRNQISDISPLKNLVNLETLWLEDNQITDISSLSDLNNLKQLFLSTNQVSDISPLKNLVNLSYLQLYNNPIPQQQIDELQKELPNCKIDY